MFVRESFRTLFQRLKNEGRIDPVLDIPTMAQVFVTIGDGMFWRRAVDPQFDAKMILPAITSVLGLMLRPVPATGGSDNKSNAAALEVQS